MLPTLRILLAALGLAAVSICLSVVALGPSATADFTEAGFNSVTRTNHPLTGAWPATMDGELRFYAPFWGVYGLALLAAARDPIRRLSWVPWLSALFFAGGVGRGVSLLTVGPPHPVFTLLMAIELLLPMVFLALWRAARGRAR